MIDQNFCPDGYPYKFYASPPTIASILFFDIIADKAHTMVQSYFQLVIQVSQNWMLAA